MSGVTINGEPQTWQQLYEREREQRRDGDRFRRLVADLSRCQHGRHRGDVCSACGGSSVGNTLLPPGTVVGHDISGRPYVVPEDRFEVDGWVAAHGP